MFKSCRTPACRADRLSHAWMDADQVLHPVGTPLALVSSGLQIGRTLAEALRKRLYAPGKLNVHRRACTNGSEN